MFTLVENLKIQLAYLHMLHVSMLLSLSDKEMGTSTLPLFIETFKITCGGKKEQENNTKSLSTLMATSWSRCVESKNTTQSYKTTRLKNFKHGSEHSYND